MNKLVEEKIQECLDRIEALKQLNEDTDLATYLFPEATIWLDYEVNVNWAAQNMDEVKAALRLLAEHGCMLKQYIANETTPAWTVTGINSTIRLSPRWSNSEGAACKLVKVGETTVTYPKYKLVCDGKEVGNESSPDNS